MSEGHDVQYEKICKPRLDRIEVETKSNNDKLHDIHRIVTNGLMEKVNKNCDRIESLDNRLWYLMGGVMLSIVLQIMFQLF